MKIEADLAFQGHKTAFQLQKTVICGNESNKKMGISLILLQEKIRQLLVNCRGEKWIKKVRRVQ